MLAIFKKPKAVSLISDTCRQQSGYQAWQRYGTIQNMVHMCEAKLPPILLSICTEVVTVLCFVRGDAWSDERKRSETCYGKRKSNNRNPLLSCAFADPIVFSFH